MSYTAEQYQAVVDAADRIDRRRRHQVDTQREAINRLLKGESPAAISAVMLTELASIRARLEEVADLVAAAPNRRSVLVKKLAVVVADD